jgi:hypothetical protein
MSSSRGHLPPIVLDRFPDTRLDRRRVPCLERFEKPTRLDRGSSDAGRCVGLHGQPPRRCVRRSLGKLVDAGGKRPLDVGAGVRGHSRESCCRQWFGIGEHASSPALMWRTAGSASGRRLRDRSVTHFRVRMGFHAPVSEPLPRPVRRRLRPPSSVAGMRGHPVDSSVPPRRRSQQTPKRPLR